MKAAKKTLSIRSTYFFFVLKPLMIIKKTVRNWRLLCYIFVPKRIFEVFIYFCLYIIKLKAVLEITISKTAFIEQIIEDFMMAIKKASKRMVKNFFFTSVFKSDPGKSNSGVTFTFL